MRLSLTAGPCKPIYLMYEQRLGGMASDSLNSARGSVYMCWADWHGTLWKSAFTLWLSVDLITRRSPNEALDLSVTSFIPCDTVKAVSICYSPQRHNGH